MSEVPPPVPAPTAWIPLTVAVVVLEAFCFVVLAPLVGTTFALAVGVVLGCGVIGGVVASRIPEPAEERLGLIGFRRRLLAIGILLLPAVIVMSEADNWVAEWLPRPAELEATAPGAAEPEEDAFSALDLADPEQPVPTPEQEAEAAAAEETDDWLGRVEWLLFAGLLRPVLEEFFFRGVLFQGIAAHSGTRAAVVLSTLLFALSRMGFGLLFTAYTGVSFAAQALVEGGLLGFVRGATGSLLACIVLHAALQMTGLAAVSLADTLPIPGFNAPGPHTPAELVALSTISVLLGTLLINRLK